jgi:hypothetical protein
MMRVLEEVLRVHRERGDEKERRAIGRGGDIDQRAVGIAGARHQRRERAGAALAQEFLGGNLGIEVG